MDTWAQKSDEAARDVFSTMRGMFGFPDVQTKIRLPGPQKPAETKGLSWPVSELVSEQGSRQSLITPRSVSELGAEAEPQWLLETTQRDSWPRCDSQVEAKPPAQRSTEVEKNLHSKEGLRDSWARTYQPPVQTQVPPLLNCPESTQTSLPTKTSVIEASFYPGPRAQRPSDQALSRPQVPPKVILQIPWVLMNRRPEEHVSKPTAPAQQQDRHPRNTTKPLPDLPLEAPVSYPPLTALLYFSLELPRSQPHHNSSYLRHHAHPMRLPLSTPQQLVASIAHLRGYFTQHPARFLSHFASYTSPSTKTSDDEVRLVVHFPSLFRAGGSRHRVERIWGTELAWAWVDASEGRFAEAMAGVLREGAEGAMREGRGGVVDVVCVVREVLDGRKGYGLLMDVRRIREDIRRGKQKKKDGKEREEPRAKQRQAAGKMAGGGEEKMWIH